MTMSVKVPVGKPAARTQAKKPGMDICEPTPRMQKEKSESDSVLEPDQVETGFASTLLADATGPVQYGLMNDYMFRAVLQKSNRTLKHLLSSLLPIPYGEICSCEITNPIVLGEAIDEKTCILDVRVRLNNSRLINLEMQVGNLNHWPNRALFYLSRLFCNIEKGQDYSKILPATHIGILSKSPFQDVSVFYSRYLMMNPENHHIFSGNFSLCMLDLSQMENVPEEERDSDLYYWARLFKAETWEEIRMLAEKSETLKEAAGYLRELGEEEKIQLQCEGRERYYMDMSCARNEGREEGRKEGRKEGEERTIELVNRFLADGRTAELMQLYDPDFYQKSLKLYHLEPAPEESSDN